MITSPELSIDVLDEKTNQFATGIQLTLIDSETKEAVETWQSSESDRKLSLTPERIYTLQVATEGTSYETIVDKDLKLAQDGQFYQKSESGDWQLIDGGLKVKLQLKDEKITESETTETTQAKEINLPKVVAVFDKSKNIPTTFELVSEDGSTKLVEWSSEKDTPKVALEADKIYIVQVVSTELGYVPDGTLKLRLNKDNVIEYLDGNEWKTASETLRLPLKDIGYSGFRAGHYEEVTVPTTINPNKAAPINPLRIIGDMPASSKVELIEINGSEDLTIKKDSIVTRWADVSGNDNKDNPIWGGGFDNDLDSVIATNAPSHNAITIEFKPSNPNVANYKMDRNAGWNKDDLSLETTSMKVKVKYTDAAYYNGELVDAIATIKVTPFKTRTDRSQQHPNGGYGYWGNKTYADNDRDKPIYYPTIQISGLLYGGWVRQNVGEFNIDLSFYKKGSNAPIKLDGGAYTSNSKATYYTINSLNPEYNYTDGAAHGPEYVVPKFDTISFAYKVPHSNIETTYNGDIDQNGKVKLQYAYHGGVGNGWGDNDDNTESLNWFKNSVMFTARHETTQINLTLGDLDRKPGLRSHPLNNPYTPEWQASEVYRSNYIWSTISTDPISNNKNIFVRKNWIGKANPAKEVEIVLYATWKENGVSKREWIQSKSLGTANNWQTDFTGIPTEAIKLQSIKDSKPYVTVKEFKYITEEVNLPSGYSVAYSGDSFKGFTVTNTQTHAGLIIAKKWQNFGTTLDNAKTSSLKPIKVILKRKVGNVIDNRFNQVIELSYNTDSNVSWKTTVNNLPIKDSQNQDYTYYIEEDKATIPDNYYLKEYLNQGIQLKYETEENQLGVTNDSYSTDLKIEKQWFKKDGTTRLQNENLPQTLTVRIFQTTNGSTSNGKLFDTVTLTRSGTGGNYVWETTKLLPLRSTDGKTYYSYYIEEDKPQGYLEISDKNQKQLINTSSNGYTQPNASMTLKNKVNPVYPSTGGLGNLPYISIGLLSLFMASIIYIMQKKKGI